MASEPRFAFGVNWSRFLSVVDEDRIAAAVLRLQQMLGVDRMNGTRFLDVGSGSGLSSLAARRLGARVHSFDVDADAVTCTRVLRDRWAPDDAFWSTSRGSALDPGFLERLGRFDVVYAWGVLHHTGAMWQAMANVEASVAEHGTLYVALYNDQGLRSRLWRRIKHLYVRLPRSLRFVVVVPCYIAMWGPPTVRDLVLLRPFATWRTYGRNRGMSAHHDFIDWVGGYPFEVSRRETVIDFFAARGYRLAAINSCGGGSGCNEFVFRRDGSPALAR